MKSVGCWPSFGLRNIRSSRPVQMCKMYASRKRAWQRQTRRQCLYLHFFPNTEFTVAMLIFPISGDLYSRGAGKVDARVWHHDGCLVSLRLFCTVCKGVAEGRRVPGSPQTDVTSSTRLRPSRPPHGAASRTPSPTLATLTTSLPTPSLPKKATNLRSSDKHNHLTQSDCKYHRPEGQEASANSTGGQVRRYTCMKVLIFIQDFNVQLLRMKP